MSEEKFNFCVGRPWKEQPESLCIYEYFGQVHYGTMTDAKNFLNYVNKKTNEENFIYRLIQVEE